MRLQPQPSGRRRVENQDRQQDPGDFVGIKAFATDIGCARPDCKEDTASGLAKRAECL